VTTNAIQLRPIAAGVARVLFGIKWAPGIGNRKKPLRIFGCEGTEKLLKAIDDAHNYKLFEQNFEVEIREIAPTEHHHSFDLLAGLTAEIISTPHRAESLAIRLADQSGATLVYTSDTGFSEALTDFARDADLLILECSFYRDKPTRKHLELADAMRIAKLAEPKQLLLTHLYPEWDDIDLEAEARKLWTGVIIAAHDGLRLEVGA